MIDVRLSPELKAAILAVKQLDKTIQKMIRVHTKEIGTPEFKQSMAQHTATRLENRVLVDTAVLSVSNQNVRMQSAGKGRALSGGLLPKVHYPAIEFGAVDDDQVYTRRNHGGQGTHQVKRHTARQLRRRAPKGHVFGPTVKDMTPRIARLWVQTVVKTVANAIEGKQE